VSDGITWRRHRRTPGSGAAHRFSRHIILRSSSPAGPDIPGMPVMGRVQCWNFTSSIRGYFAACLIMRERLRVKSSYEGLPTGENFGWQTWSGIVMSADVARQSG
jgi:hypothetical protein